MKKVILLLLVFLMFAQPVLAANEKAYVLVQDGKNVIELSGEASCGGQNVQVQILKPGFDEAKDLSDIVFQRQVTVDENGMFLTKFTAPLTMKSGVYPVQFFYENGKKETTTIEYKNSADLSADFVYLKEAEPLLKQELLLNSTAKNGALTLRYILLCQMRPKIW